MPLASCVNYVASLLNNLAWPAAMQALPNPPPNLQCFVQPPDPNVLASVPQAYVWFEMWDESRNAAKYGAGTVPRAQYQGGPSGTKVIAHVIPVYIVWMGGSATDQYASTLFPGMIDAIMATLRTSTNPAPVTDPWDGTQTQVVDIGEVMSGRGYLRDTEPMQLQRLDALLTVPVVEVLSS